MICLYQIVGPSTALMHCKLGYKMAAFEIRLQYLEKCQFWQYILKKFSHCPALLEANRL